MYSWEKYLKKFLLNEYRLKKTQMNEHNIVSIYKDYFE